MLSSQNGINRLLVPALVGLAALACVSKPQPTTPVAEIPGLYLERIDQELAGRVARYQAALDEWYLAVAIVRGILPETAGPEDLTIAVRSEMKQYCIHEAAVSLGYLPPDSTRDDLTIDVREQMLRGGYRIGDIMPDCEWPLPEEMPLTLKIEPLDY